MGKIENHEGQNGRGKEETPADERTCDQSANKEKTLVIQQVKSLNTGDFNGPFKKQIV